MFFTNTYNSFRWSLHIIVVNSIVVLHVWIAHCTVCRGVYWRNRFELQGVRDARSAGNARGQSASDYSWRKRRVENAKNTCGGAVQGARAHATERTQLGTTRYIHLTMWRPLLVPPRHPHHTHTLCEALLYIRQSWYRLANFRPISFALVNPNKTKIRFNYLALWRLTNLSGL